MIDKLLLIGGGGHCKSVLDCLLQCNSYAEIGIVEKDTAPFNDLSLGVPVVGSDGDLPRLRNDGWSDAFITVGSIGSPALRRKLYDKVCELGFAVPSIVDKSAVVSGSVAISAGVFVGKNATVNAGTRLGVCSIINTGAIIEHDCVIGNFAHISPGAVLCGQITIGENTHVGANSTIRQLLTIGRDSIIGIGSVVTKAVPERVMAYGNPCRVEGQLP